MTLDGNAGTATTTPEAPPAAGTHAPADEVTTLRSRNAGLDAKVTALLAEKAAIEAKAAAAEARALELAQAKEGGDAELRAELERTKAENLLAKREAQLAKIEAKYPETFAVLGQAAAGLADDVLAASEARFRGVAGEPPETDTPQPLGANPPRQPAPGAKRIEDMNVAELQAHLRTFSGSVLGLPED